jgi:hypothetical protein
MAFIPEDGVMPPQTMTVDHDHKPVLYLPDGRALVRQAGFRVEGRDAVSRVLQTTSEVSRPRRAGAG